MQKEKILVIGASGQIGVELTLALRNIYGNNNVIASDLREENDLLKGTGPYVSLDVMNKEMLHVQVIAPKLTCIFTYAINSCWFNNCLLRTILFWTCRPKNSNTTRPINLG